MKKEEQSQRPSVLLYVPNRKKPALSGSFKGSWKDNDVCRTVPASRPWSHTCAGREEHVLANSTQCYELSFMERIYDDFDQQAVSSE